MHQQFLKDDELRQIHDAAMRIAAQIGVDFPLETALAVFRRHGARVEGQRVFLTEAQITEWLAHAPRQFTIEARNPARSVVVGGGRPVFAPGYGAPFLVDTREGKRTPTLADYHALVKLAHALPNQDLSGHLIVEPEGTPAGRGHVPLLHAHMLHSDKPFIGSAAGTAGAMDSLRMASILFDGDVHDRPVMVSLVNSRTPLGYGTEMIEALMLHAEWGQPLIVAALAMGGSTAPVTLAGILALQTAELLAGLVLAQMVNPGTPVIFGSTSSNIHMKTGALSIGGPELSILIAAHAQLARFYGLPSRSGGALTDANYPDAQSGYESMMALLTTVNCGVDFVLHAGGILSSFLAFSYEKFVLDDEACGMVRAMARGLAVEPDTLAYDVIAEVGPGGNYLVADHTVERCRTAFWQPVVADRAGLDAWVSGGKVEAVARAEARWKRLVAQHKDPALDEITLRQLQAYVDNA